MAALDRLLEALVEKKMEALMLEPESRPRMRKSGAERDVSTSVLTAPTIEGLLAQVAPEGVIADTPAPGRADFEYRLNGTLFRLTCLRTDAGWSALVVIDEEGEVEPEEKTDFESRLAAAGHTLDGTDEVLADQPSGG